jgi:signal transduction histidine kinase
MATPNGNLYRVGMHCYSEARSFQMTVHNMLHWIRQNTIQQPETYTFDYEHFPPIIAECIQLVSGEAEHKNVTMRCELRMPSGVPVTLEFAQLMHGSDLAKALIKAFILEHHSKLHPNDLEAQEVHAYTQLKGATNEVQLSMLSERCYEIISGCSDGAAQDLSVWLTVRGSIYSLRPADVPKCYWPRMEMIRPELTLAFLNLLHNAVKYSYTRSRHGEERYIRVVIAFQRSYFTVEISNYGTGILQYEIDNGKIWEPNYRGLLSGDKNRIGCGLGLTYAKRVIEGMHGGKIRVQSRQQPSKAYLTTFTVLLPQNQKSRILE